MLVHPFLDRRVKRRRCHLPSELLKTGGHLSVSATGYFGSLTKAAAASWQAANGVSPAAGYFGSISRAKYDGMTVTAVSASSAASSVALISRLIGELGGRHRRRLDDNFRHATGRHFGSQERGQASLQCKVTLTAGSQDVTVTGITVERTGLANDAAFSGVVLLDDAGTQLGIAKTFNSDHKATVGDTVKITAGTSKTFTVAGNMASRSNQLRRTSRLSFRHGSYYFRHGQRFASNIGSRTHDQQFVDDRQRDQRGWFY